MSNGQVLPIISKARWKYSSREHPGAGSGCAFIGTTNEREYLRDASGARRFWPLQCGRIDTDSLTRDREQLLAEARVRFESGAAWWLDSAALLTEATAEQAERYEADPWQEAIERWAEGREPFGVEEVLTRALEKPIGVCTQADRNRVGRCLRVLGYERFQHRTGGERGARRWRKAEANELEQVEHESN